MASKFIDAYIFKRRGAGRMSPQKCHVRGKKPEELFAAVKVKMVMRVYGVSRAKALEIIVRREAEDPPAPVTCGSE